MSTTINQTITTTWESIEFTHLSNVSFANKSVVQLWAGTVAPTSTSYGHTLDAGMGAIPIIVLPSHTGSSAQTSSHMNMYGMMIEYLN